LAGAIRWISAIFGLEKLIFVLIEISLFEQGDSAVWWFDVS